MKNNSRKIVVEQIWLTIKTQILKGDNIQFEKWRRKRAVRDFNIIKKWVWGNEVLDYGCGRGGAGAMIAGVLGKKVTLTDVENRNETALPFYLCASAKTNFKDNQFDSVILLNVLHHSSNSELLVREAARVSRKRIIILERHLYQEKQEEERSGLNKREWATLCALLEAIYHREYVKLKNLFYLQTYSNLQRIFKKFRFKLIFEKYIPPKPKNLLISGGRLFFLDKMVKNHNLVRRKQLKKQDESPRH